MSLAVDAKINSSKLHLSRRLSKLWNVMQGSINRIGSESILFGSRSRANIGGVSFFDIIYNLWVRSFEVTWIYVDQ